VNAVSFFKIRGFPLGGSISAMIASAEQARFRSGRLSFAGLLASEETVLTSLFL